MPHEGRRWSTLLTPVIQVECDLACVKTGPVQNLRPGRGGV